MKTQSTLFLRLVIIIISIPVLALCIFIFPGFLQFAFEILPKLSYLMIPVGILLYSAAILYFYALTQGMNLLNLIDQNRAFSLDSVKALKHIQYCALIISVNFSVITPLVYVVADVDDAPGLLLFTLIIIFITWIIATFAAILHRLLKDALVIKTENELTI